MCGIRPLAGQQDRTAPLAADADALQRSSNDEQHATPDPDSIVAGNQADRDGGDSHEQQRGDERALATDPVAEVAANDGTERTRDETDEIRREREQGTREWIRLRKEYAGKHQRGRNAIEEEVVPLDGRPDGRRNHGAPHHAAPSRAVERDGADRNGVDVLRHPSSFSFGRGEQPGDDHGEREQGQDLPASPRARRACEGQPR